MTSRHNLPAEILCGIFNNLEPSDILQCQKVCKAWCAPVQTIIYTHVHLKNAEESTIVAYFATINANPSLEKLAKSLGFSKGYHRVYELLLDFGSVNTIFRNISKTENIKRLFESKAMGISYSGKILTRNQLALLECLSGLAPNFFYGVHHKKF